MQPSTCCSSRSSLSLSLELGTSHESEYSGTYIKLCPLFTVILLNVLPISLSLHLNCKTFPFFGYNFEVQRFKCLDQKSFSDHCMIAQNVAGVHGTMDLIGRTLMFWNLGKWGMAVILSGMWNSTETTHFEEHKLYHKK